MSPSPMPAIKAELFPSRDIRAALWEYAESRADRTQSPQANVSQFRKLYRRETSENG
jgi:hypothetical protein